MKIFVYQFCDQISSLAIDRSIILTLSGKKLMMTSEKNTQIAQAQEAFQLMHQISQLLCTGLDTESLAICIRLCELGVDPETLAHVIWEIRKMGEKSTQDKPNAANPNI